MSILVEVLREELNARKNEIIKLYSLLDQLSKQDGFIDYISAMEALSAENSRLKSALQKATDSRREPYARILKTQNGFQLSGCREELWGKYKDEEDAKRWCRDNGYEVLP